MTEREENILNLLEQHRYLERSMVGDRLLKFPAGQAKARQLLYKMYSREVINRFKPGAHSEYVYHLGKRSEKWRHWLDLNRFHFGLLAELKQWQRILYWDHEVKYPGGQADGFYIIKTSLQSGVYFFLEMDDGTNKFDKLKKYLAYQQSRAWKREWWAKESFPLVLIVTPRIVEIGELIRRCKAEPFFKIMRKEVTSKEYCGKILATLLKNERGGQA